jgi:hypothetical protein
VRATFNSNQAKIMTTEKLRAEILKIQVAQNSKTPKFSQALDFLGPKIAAVCASRGLAVRKIVREHSVAAADVVLQLVRVGSGSPAAEWVFPLRACGYWRPVTPTALSRALGQILTTAEVVS